MLHHETISGTVSAVELIQASYQLGPHCHHAAQLMLVVRGLVICEVAQGLWLVPPQSALWIPARMTHSMRGVSDLQLYCVYIDPRLTTYLPRKCCVLTVSPLVRELVIEMSRPLEHRGGAPPDGRMIGIMLERLATAPSE